MSDFYSICFFQLRNQQVSHKIKYQTKKKKILISCIKKTSMSEAFQENAYYINFIVYL